LSTWAHPSSPPTPTAQLWSCLHHRSTPAYNSPPIPCLISPSVASDPSPPIPLHSPRTISSQNHPSPTSATLHLGRQYHPQSRSLQILPANGRTMRACRPAIIPRARRTHPVQLRKPCQRQNQCRKISPFMVRAWSFSILHVAWLYPPKARQARGSRRKLKPLSLSLLQWLLRLTRSTVQDSQVASLSVSIPLRRVWMT
jgi:hypothetical protein